MWLGLGPSSRYSSTNFKTILVNFLTFKGQQFVNVNKIVPLKVQCPEIFSV